MKKKIKLLGLNRNELKDVIGSQQTICVPGSVSGVSCTCGCYYSGEPGGSSTEDNDAANDAEGLHSVAR